MPNLKIVATNPGKCDSQTILKWIEVVDSISRKAGGGVGCSTHSVDSTRLLKILTREKMVRALKVSHEWQEQII